MSSPFERKSRPSIYIGSVALFALISAAAALALEPEFLPPAVLVQIQPGGGSNPRSLCTIDEAVVFIADHPLHSDAVWRTDGTAAGTRLLLDETGTTLTGSILLCQETRPQAFVSRSSPESAAAIWAVSSDGVPEKVLADFDGEPRIGFPRGSAVVGGRTLFLLQQLLGDELWATDGTAAGTRLLLDPVPGPGGATLHILAGQEAAWVVSLEIMPRIWRSDGTPSGTLLVHPGFDSAGSSVSFLGSAGALLIATVFDQSAQTSRLVGFSPDGEVTTLASGSPNGPSIQLALSASDRLYLFSATDLWVTDGTVEGTAPIVIGGVQTPDLAITLGRSVIFWRSTKETGVEAWASDGTPAGTRLLLDLCPGSCSSLPDLSGSQFGAVVSGFDDGGTLVTHFIDSNLDAGLALAGPCTLPCLNRAVAIGDVHNRVLLLGDDGSGGTDLWALHPLQRTLERLSAGGTFGDLRGVGRAGSAAILFAPAAFGGEPGVVRRQTNSCGEAIDVLCLQDNRFRVSTRWRDFEDRQGLGVAQSVSPDTGYFWFFDAANVELMTKLVDGTGTNGHFWFFYGALSNAGYDILIEDLVAGGSRDYSNAVGAFGSFGDIGALPAGLTARSGTAHLAMSLGENILEATPPTQLGSCAPSATRVCLLGGRFALEGSWSDFAGNSGVAYAEALTSDTGYLWFFDLDVVEIVAKLVDGGGLNDHFWVYYGSLSNVEFTLFVTDTVTGETKPYFNPLGTFGSLGDIEAFPAD